MTVTGFGAADFGMDLSCDCDAAILRPRLELLRQRAEKRRAGVDRLFALREPTWVGRHDSGALGGSKQAGGGAFSLTGSVNQG